MTFSFSIEFPLTICMKFRSAAYRLILNFWEAAPLTIIQSTILFKIYFKLNVFDLGVLAIDFMLVVRAADIWPTTPKFTSEMIGNEYVIKISIRKNSIRFYG